MNIRIENEGRVLRRDPNGMIGGVCGGLAAFFGISPSRLRLAMVVLAFLTFFSVIILYAGLWIIIPRATTEKELGQIRENREKYK